MKILGHLLWIFPFLLMCPSCDSAQVGEAHVEKLESEIEEKQKARSDLEKEISEAIDLEAWVLASMPLQPLVMAIIKSMGPGSDIEHLQLERDAETPSQLRFRLVLKDASDKQLEQTLEAIREMNYREFNQTQTLSDGEIVYTVYTARLLREDPPPQSRQTPEQRQKSSATVPLISQQKTEGIDPGVGEARTEEGELQTRLGIEQESRADLQRQSADLLNFVAVWKPYFALVEEQQNVQAGISMRVRNGDLVPLSQRYEQVPHRIAQKETSTLPTLTRATFLFDDNFGKLMNWLGATEKAQPAARVGKLDLAKGSRGNDIRMELTLEVPLLRRGS